MYKCLSGRFLLTTTTSTSTKTRTTTSTLTTTLHVKHAAITVNIAATIEASQTDTPGSRRRICFTVLALYTDSYRRISGSSSALPQLEVCTVTPLNDGSGQSSVQVRIVTAVRQEQGLYAKIVSSLGSVTTKVQERLTSPEKALEVAQIVRRTVIEQVALVKVVETAEAVGQRGHEMPSSSQILAFLPLEPDVVDSIKSELPSAHDINTGASLVAFVSAGASPDSPAPSTGPLASAFALVPDLPSTINSATIPTPTVTMY